MCNRYVAPDPAAIERAWHVGGRTPVRRWERNVYPRAAGPFIRAAGGERELVVGPWGLIPHFAKTAKLPYATNNARSEELARKASFRQPWARGQRCIIPAISFDEPCWETGRNVWWSFRRADDEPWGLAGLWNTWVDPATGEVLESYTLLTLNADAHPLMRRMHKPDPKLGPDQQDKRSVIPIEQGDVDAWLRGTTEEATALLRLAPVDLFDAGPLGSGAAVQASLL
jgi:putative SOS response-associated peptidase YedK